MKIKSTILLLIIVNLLLSQTEFPPANGDFKYHNLNKVRLLRSNMGAPAPNVLGVGGFPYALNYPSGSPNSFLAYWGFWIGAKVGEGDVVKLSQSASWSQDVGSVHEFFPDFRSADTLYEISTYEKSASDADPKDVRQFFQPNGQLDPDFYPISEEDIIGQYYDYKITKNTPEAPQALQYHNPLYTHVIQRSYAWSMEWYEDIIFVDYYIINEGNETWKDLYFSVYSDPHSGNFEQGVSTYDDLNYYLQKYDCMVQGDHPGTEGDDFVGGKVLVAYKILGSELQDSIPDQKSSFVHWGEEARQWPEAADQTYNAKLYQYLADGNLDLQGGPDWYGVTGGNIGKGPYGDVAPGDTIKITIAIIMGMGESELYNNIKTASNLYDSGFNVPKAPTPPKPTLEPRNHAIKVDWSWKDSYEGVRPEESVDESRTDGIRKDFDGYKVYRSSGGPYGPWKLIAQSDSINGHGYDLGLQREYLDTDLKNGLEYWYSVTSFDIRDDSAGIGPLETPITYNVESTFPSPDPKYSQSDKVYVVPNPYRADLDYSQNPAWEYPTQELRTEWYEIDRRIAFMNLPPECKIQIFTLNGIKVKEMEHNRSQKGHNILSWNLMNDNNHTVGSGIYYFVVEGLGNDSFKQVGKFVIVK